MDKNRAGHRHKREMLALCRLALYAPEPVPPLMETIDAFMQRVAQIDIAVCNEFRNRRFKVIAAIAPLHHFVRTGPLPSQGKPGRHHNV